MTAEELKKVPFHCVASLSLRDEHLLAYSSKDGKLGFQICTPMHDGKPKGEAYRVWRIGDKWYENYLEFLADLKDFHVAKIVKFEPRKR